MLAHKFSISPPPLLSPSLSEVTVLLRLLYLCVLVFHALRRSGTCSTDVGAWKVAPVVWIGMNGRVRAWEQRRRQKCSGDSRTCYCARRGKKKKCTPAGVRVCFDAQKRACWTPCECMLFLVKFHQTVEVFFLSFSFIFNQAVSFRSELISLKHYLPLTFILYFTCSSLIKAKPVSSAHTQKKNNI